MLATTSLLGETFVKSLLATHRSGVGAVLASDIDCRVAAPARA